MAYGNPPYHESGFKAALRMAAAGAAAGIGSVQAHGGLGNLFTGFAGGVNARSAAEKAAQEYAMKQLAAQEERDFRNFQIQNIQSEIAARGKEKTPPIQDWQRTPEEQAAIIDYQGRLKKATAAEKTPKEDFSNAPWYLDPKYKNTPEAKAAQKAALMNQGGDTSWIGTYARTTRSGKRFLDISELTGKDHAAAVRWASEQGIPAIGSADVSQLQDIDAARGNIEGMLSQADRLLPKDAQGRAVSIPGIRLSQVLQTSAQRAAFNTWRGAAIRNFRAVAGSKGLRLNQKEIDLAVRNEIPQITDTYDVAKAKMENVRTMLNNAEGPILQQNWGGGIQQADPLGIR